MFVLRGFQIMKGLSILGDHRKAEAVILGMFLSK